MKCARVSMLAAAFAAVSMGAMAQDDPPAAPRESAPFGMPASSADAQAKPPAPRVPLFAAASAALSRRLAPDQLFERGFLRDAAAHTRFEFEAGRMALAKSTSPTVRAFADQLVTHHEAVTPVLQHMLQARGMAAPMLANDHRKALNRLAKASGRKFDQEFLASVGQKSQHEEVQLYERASVAVKDPALKAWIDKTLPAVKNNLAVADQVAAPGVKTARTQSHTVLVAHPGQASSTQLMGAPAAPQPGSTVEARSR